ncbi:3'(2'),5'-bisphosphate nucleotidase CysQ [Fodinicurvata fenggangensis]|uniref:3'(2'),5'-bisphosphate nucleotidase CysQ n=1 Tax=Fodinicurvata fenggangensis TaxID=1121830 RepID=UPI000555B30C|nr:3'(2'),5'-bisphosphate nucleotidase CysQ [Fodinicurvata fenggangensis]
MDKAAHSMDRQQMIDELRVLAEAAGKVTLRYYGKGDEMGLREKEDSSPVTKADEACEVFILEALAKMTPDLPVISEEAAEAGKLPDLQNRQPFWLVDPLDGTKEFISGNGEFTVNIALIEKGTPVLGVVHAPALGKSWIGADNQAFFARDGESFTPIEARQRPAEGLTVVASRRHGGGDELETFLAGYQVADRVSAGSSLKFCLVAQGEADLYPRFGRTMEWDTAAGQAVLQAAGGRVETRDGVPLAYGKPGFENPYFIAFGRD